MAEKNAREKWIRKNRQEEIRLDHKMNQDKLFPEGAVIMGSDHLPEVSAEEMREKVVSIVSGQELVDAFAAVHNKFWFIEDDVYDYKVGTEEYKKFCTVVEAWGDLMDDLERRVREAAEKEGLLAEKQADSGTAKQIEAFMRKYGYRDGRGWWVRVEE